MEQQSNLILERQFTPPLIYGSRRLTSNTHRLSRRIRSTHIARQHDLRQIAQLRRAAAEPIYDFALGETCGPLPKELKETAIQALLSDEPVITSPAGSDTLRQAVLQWLKSSSLYHLENVAICGGAAQGLYELLLALCDADDSVLFAGVPSSSYLPTALLAAVEAKILKAQNKETLKISEDELIDYLETSPPVRCLVLCNPCDPTGQLYQQAEIDALLRTCADYGLYLILDRRYWQTILTPTSYPEPTVDEHTAPWLIQLDSISYCLPHASGLRVGWLLGPADVAEAVVAVQSQLRAVCSEVSQHIARCALEGDYFRQNAEDLRRKYHLFSSLAANLPDVRIIPTEGTLFSFWDLTSTLGKITPQGTVLRGSEDLCEYLLESAGVAAMPGTCFAQEGYLRFSFSVPESTITAGLEATAKALRALR